MSHLETPESQVLKLLLEGSRVIPEDWRRLLSVTTSNVVLVRCRDAFVQLNIPMQREFAAAAATEQERIRETVSLIAKLMALCTSAGIECVFTKAFQHYPDMGHDIDLFVADRSQAIDTLMKDRFDARLLPGSFANWVSGKTGYQIPGRTTPVEIHHGRLGHLGEHERFARKVVARRRQVTVQGITVWVPSVEDQLLLQGLQRIYGHLTIRLADVCASAGLLRRGDLDWDYIFATAEESGIREGFLFYLACIDEIVFSTTGRRLLLPNIPRSKTAVSFQELYRISMPSAAKFYFLQMVSAGGGGDAGMLSRLALLPLCAGIAAARRIL